MGDIRKHKAGYSLVNKLHELQYGRTRDGFWHKFFAMSPLEPESRSWYVGLLGELETGRLLDGLTQEGFTVLHSVPIGVKGSDIDHVVISPSGLIYTINTKYHSGKKIWAGGKTLMVNGQKEPYIRNSLYEAQRVSAKLPDKSIVTPLMVFINPQSITQKNSAVVTLLDVSDLQRYLRLQEKERKYMPSNPALTLLADSTFWTAAYVDETQYQEERFSWFKQLHRTVRSRGIRRRFAALLILLSPVVLILIGLYAATEILSSSM